MFESHPKMIIQISINIPNEQNQANNMTNPRLQLEHDHSFVVDIHVPLGKVSTTAPRANRNRSLHSYDQHLASIAALKSNP